MKQKGFTPILILLIVVAFGVVGYFGYKNYQSNGANFDPYLSVPATSSPVDKINIENWKTYTDLEWNYSINYPQTFTFMPKDNSSDYIVISKPGGEILGTEAFSHFKIVVEKDSSLNLDDAIKSEMENARDLFDKSIIFTKIEVIKLGNQSAKSYYHSGIGYQQHIFVQDNKTKEILKFTISFASQSVQMAEQNEVDQILSTFKFTN